MTLKKCYCKTFAVMIYVTLHRHNCFVIQNFYSLILLLAITSINPQLYRFQQGWQVNPNFIMKIRPPPNAIPFDLVRDFFRQKRNAGMFDVIPGLGGQEAYRLRRSTIVKAPTNLPFRQGSPHQFSFDCTFRAPPPGQAPPEPYDLMKITNAANDEVASLNVNPNTRTVNCVLPQGPNGPQHVTFQNPPVSTRCLHYFTKRSKTKTDSKCF